jgi:hypothetical protein
MPRVKMADIHRSRSPQRCRVRGDLSGSGARPPCVLAMVGVSLLSCMRRSVLVRHVVCGDGHSDHAYMPVGHEVKLNQ